MVEGRRSGLGRSEPAVIRALAVQVEHATEALSTRRTHPGTSAAASHPQVNPPPEPRWIRPRWGAAGNSRALATPAHTRKAVPRAPSPSDERIVGGCHARR
ncbi:hypothetical protein [Streptomyces dysideae]|uniref:Uncharacterized protein n=1 Tax=Streptomyces dysideae TaxID=909626 RepID=A0A124IF82_9ACTN|nr:hypothetical protein [Streptomyces dysideae]KUO20615.1 hypothetical protein AQJ91_13730 [Streptomyces dysideae]